MQLNQDDLNYWGMFVGIALSVTLMLSFITAPGNIIACSFIGAFAAVVPIDHYCGSNLRYLVISNVRRATVDNYNFAVIDPPFQTKGNITIMVLLLNSIEKNAFHKLWKN